LSKGGSGGSRRHGIARPSATPAAAAASVWPRIAIWLVCLAPIAILPGAFNRWAWPTLLLVVAASVAAAIATASGRLPRALTIGVGVAFVILVVAALLGSSPLAQIFGRAPRYEGLVTLPVIAAAVWIGARMLGPRVPGALLRDAMIATSVASMLLAFVGVLESIGLRPIETDLDRPGSLAGNATDQGVLGALFLAVLANMVLGAWRRTGTIAWWGVAGSVAAVAAVATSASRAAALAAGVVVLALIVRFIVTAQHRRRAVAIGAGGLAAFTAMLLVLPYTRERLLGFDDLARRTVEDRLIMWDQAWQVFLTSPWLGVGPSGFADAVTAHFGDDWYQRASTQAVLDSPHSVFMQALVAGGVVGAVVAVVLVAGTLVLGIRNMRPATGARRDLMIAGLVALPAGGLALLTTVSSPKTLVPLAVLAGCLVAVAPVTRVFIDRMRVAALAVWLIVLVVWTVGDFALLSAVRSSAQGDFAAADGGFTAAAAARPWDADIPLIAAASLTSALANGMNGAADDAQRWAASAADRLPDSARAWQLVGVAALHRGELEDAGAALDRATELSPADPRLWHERGVVALSAGDLGAAQSALERAVALAPDSRVSWTALQDVCERTGDDACVERVAAALPGG
jgi:O-antigen ligase